MLYTEEVLICFFYNILIYISEKVDKSIFKMAMRAMREQRKKRWGVKLGEMFQVPGESYLLVYTGGLFTPKPEYRDSLGS